MYSSFKHIICYCTNKYSDNRIQEPLKRTDLRLNEKLGFFCRAFVLIELFICKAVIRSGLVKNKAFLFPVRDSFDVSECIGSSVGKTVVRCENIPDP